MSGNKYYPRYSKRTRSNTKPYSAKSVMAGAIPNIPLGSCLREYKIKNAWPGIVGKAIAERTHPGGLIKGTLYCVVVSSTWMTELNYQKPIIIEKINKALGMEAVKDLVFKPGVLPDLMPRPQQPPPAKCTLSDKTIEEAASKISDNSLRKLVSRVMKKSIY